MSSKQILGYGRYFGGYRIILYFARWRYQRHLQTCKKSHCLVFGERSLADSVPGPRPFGPVSSAKIFWRVMPYWHDCCPLKAVGSKRYKHASTAAAHIAKSLFSAVCVFANSQQSNVDPLVQLCFLSQIIRYYFYLGLNLKKRLSRISTSILPSETKLTPLQVIQQCSFAYILNIVMAVISVIISVPLFDWSKCSLHSLQSRRCSCS